MLARESKEPAAVRMRDITTALMAPPDHAGARLPEKERRDATWATARRRAQRRALGGAAIDLGSGFHAGGGAHAGAGHRGQQRDLLAGRRGAHAAAAVWNARAAGDALGADAHRAEDRRVAAQHARLEPAEPVVR